MNKSFLLWMIAMLVLSVGMTGCSSDDDGIDFESLDDNHKNIIGEWQLLYYEGGSRYDNYMQLNPGDVTLTFTKNETVKVKGANAENEQYTFPIRSGNYKYYFKETTYGKNKETYLGIGVGENPDNLVWAYGFSFENGWLILWDNAFYYAGKPFIYKLKKVGP